MWFGVVWKWFGVVWCRFGWFGVFWGGLGCFNGPILFRLEVYSKRRCAETGGIYEQQQQ